MLVSYFGNDNRNNNSEYSRINAYVEFRDCTMNLKYSDVSFLQYINNKYILVFGQWFVSILLGNIFSYWYILSIYKPLLPESKYVGYNSSVNKSIYKDDIDDYVQHSEVHFGKFWDAEKRRNKIEMICLCTK